MGGALRDLIDDYDRLNRELGDLKRDRDQLREALDEANNDGDSMAVLLKKLWDEDEKARIIAVLADALHFYADPETYFAIMVAADPPCGEFVEDCSDDHGHPNLDGPRYGKRARTALREAFGVY